MNTWLRRHSRSRHLVLRFSGVSCSSEFLIHEPHRAHRITPAVHQESSGSGAPTGLLHRTQCCLTPATHGHACGPAVYSGVMPSSCSTSPTRCRLPVTSTWTLLPSACLTSTYSRNLTMAVVSE